MSPSFLTVAHMGKEVATVLLVEAVLAAAPLVQAGERENREAAEAERDRAVLEESLTILATGDVAARWEVAAETGGRFKALDSRSISDEERDRIVEELRRYFRHEEDEWISLLLLELLDSRNWRTLGPLYLDVLAGPSPNLRWWIFKRLSDLQEPEAVPLLEQAWPGERRPWAKRDLIHALAWNHSSRYIEEFRNLAAGDDPSLSSAAIGAIVVLEDAGSVSLLADLAREGTDWQKREAADALSIAPESPLALAALLDATDDGDWRTRGCAVRSLAGRSEPIAMARALAVVLTDPETEVHKWGANILVSSRWDPVIQEVIRRAPRRLEDDRDTVERQILAIMDHLAVPPAKPSAGEERSRGPAVRDSRCVYFSPGELVPDDPQAVRASPPQGMGSTRCFLHPGFEGDPRDQSRVPRGTLLLVEDHFEGRDGPWVDVSGLSTPRRCWVPAARVVKPWGEAPPKEKDGILEHDFDLAADDLEDPYFIALKEAGMARIIEPGEGSVGVSLRIRMGVPEDEEMVRQAELFPQSPASTNVYWTILDAFTRLCDYPSMMKLAINLGQQVNFCDDPPAAGDGPTADSLIP
jgi:hypothetical protein